MLNGSSWNRQREREKHSAIEVRSGWFIKRKCLTRRLPASFFSSSFLPYRLYEQYLHGFRIKQKFWGKRRKIAHPVFHRFSEEITGGRMDGEDNGGRRGSEGNFLEAKAALYLGSGTIFLKRQILFHSAFVSLVPACLARPIGPIL